MTTTPGMDAIAHRELAVRVALEKADIDVGNLEVAAALLSVAIDAFRLDDKAGLLQLVGDLYDVVQQKPLPPIKRGQNACCEHVARGISEVAGEADLKFMDRQGNPFVVLVRLCAPCLQMASPVQVVAVEPPGP